MPEKKRLDPRFKRKGDGTLSGKIRTKVTGDSYREGWDRIFGKKKKDKNKELKHG